MRCVFVEGQIERDVVALVLRESVKIDDEINDALLGIVAGKLHHGLNGKPKLADIAHKLLRQLLLNVKLKLCLTSEARERHALSNVHDLLPEQKDVVRLVPCLLIFGELVLQLLELANDKVGSAHVLYQLRFEFLFLGLLKGELELLEVVVEKLE